MTDGSVPPLCQAGFNPTALWLRSSVSLMMRKDGAGQRFDRGEEREADTCLCRMYERNTTGWKWRLYMIMEKLGSKDYLIRK